MLFKFRYLKLSLFVICIILAYILFKNPVIKNFVLSLENLSYMGVFIAGLFFSFGFTSPFSAGFFITLNTENIFLSGVLGGLGAMLADLFIFSLIRLSFKDEFLRLEKTKIVREVQNAIDKTIGKKLEHYLMYAFAGILIASPLPDEVGVTMLAGLTKIKPGILCIISFVLNSLGIIILLGI